MSMTPSGWCNNCEIHSITLKRYEKLVQQKIQQLADIEDEDILVQEKIRLTQQDIRKIRAYETKDRCQEFIKNVSQTDNTIFVSNNNDIDSPLRGASNALQVPPPTKSYRPLVPAAHISNIPPSFSQELLRTTLEKEFGKVLGLTVWEYHRSAMVNFAEMQSYRKAIERRVFKVGPAVLTISK
ncbi:12858_t:CDS:2 [Cetraspora pellucida]|uniref:12858_t:CDS:1 n=1 Tax=Cetraspora pellucida TaxID=1433469 RepID=A0A9N8VHH5_9GLOM|nr:12858_t:CDS:2 [Cetraspora pellucida]